MTNTTVDARRLLCPLPVIRLQDHMENLQIDSIVQIICHDPGVVNDIPAWCRINGHEVLQIDETAEEITITVKKSG